MGLLVKDDAHVRVSLQIDDELFSVIGLMEGTNFPEIEPADRTRYLLEHMIPHDVLQGKNYNAAIDAMASRGFVTSFPTSATYNNEAANYTTADGVDGADLLNTLHINDVNIYPHANRNNTKSPGVLGGTPNGILGGTSDALIANVEMPSPPQDINGYNNIFDGNLLDNPPKFWDPMLQAGVSETNTEYLLENVNMAVAMDEKRKIPNGDKHVLQYVEGLLKKARVHKTEATSAAEVFLKYIDVFASWQGAYRDIDRESLIIDESSMMSYDDVNDEDYVDEDEASSTVSSFTGIGTGDGRPPRRKKAKTTHDSWQPSSDDPREDDDSNYDGQEVDLINYRTNTTYKSEASIGHKALTGGVRKGHCHRGVGPAPFSLMRRPASSPGDFSSRRRPTSSASQTAASSSRTATSSGSRSTTSSEVNAVFDRFKPIYSHDLTPYPNEVPILGVSILPGPGSSNAMKMNPKDKLITTVASEQRVQSLRDSADYCGMTIKTDHNVHYDYWPNNQYRGCKSFPKHITNGTNKHNSMGTNMFDVHYMTLVNINERRDGVEPGSVKAGDVVTSYGDDIIWVKECWYVGVYQLLDGRKLGRKVGIVKVMYDQLHLYVNRVGVVAEKTIINKKAPTERFQQDVFGCLTVNLIDGNFTRDIPDHLIVRSN